MDKKEIQDATREYFKSIGFQVLKKTRFFYDNEELTLQVMMDRSFTFFRLVCFLLLFQDQGTAPRNKVNAKRRSLGYFGRKLGI